MIRAKLSEGTSERSRYDHNVAFGPAPIFFVALAIFVLTARRPAGQVSHVVPDSPIDYRFGHHEKQPDRGRAAIAAFNFSIRQKYMLCDGTCWVAYRAKMNQETGLCKNPYFNDLISVARSRRAGRNPNIESKN